MMVYEDYNENFSLFELGLIVSGGDLFAQRNGTITIIIAE